MTRRSGGEGGIACRLYVLADPQDEWFTPCRPGRNMRQLRPGYYDRALRLV